MAWTVRLLHVLSGAEAPALRSFTLLVLFVSSSRILRCTGLSSGIACCYASRVLVGWSQTQLETVWSSVFFVRKEALTDEMAQRLLVCESYVPTG